MKKQSGNHSSKYALNPQQFEKDIADKVNEHNKFKKTIRQLILSDPSKMDLRLSDAIEELKSIKQEFNL